MSIILQKGSEYNAEYTSADFPVLTADWVGSISLYAAYPGTATFSKALVRAGNVMTLNLTIAEILNLADGLYSFVTTISNPVLGVTITTLDYATVSAVNVSPATKCKLFGTILKGDGTPAGKEGQSVSNTVGGITLALNWRGVQVSTAVPLADAYSGDIIGIETLTTTTNAAGYFEQYVIQGLTVNVSSPSFGKTVQVDTTGLAEKDLSSYF